MTFDRPLLLGRLVRRYKRFLADVDLDDGRRVTAHVANSGSMRGCADPGLRVALSEQDRPGRKLKWSWELVRVEDAWVGINTMLPNRIVAEAIAAGRIGPLRGYPEQRAEVPYGRNSRIDLLLTRGGERCYVEVKNCTMRQGRRALFPDAVTERGRKHMVELERMVEAGHRAVIFFLVNRGDCGSMGPADHIDPAYGQALRRAVTRGVLALAYRTRVGTEGIAVERKLPVHLEEVGG